MTNALSRIPEMHYALMEPKALPECWSEIDIARQSGLGFHLHNGRTTNAFCINSGDLMAAAETRHSGRGALGRGWFEAVITQS